MCSMRLPCQDLNGSYKYTRHMLSSCHFLERQNNRAMKQMLFARSKVVVWHLQGSSSLGSHDADTAEERLTQLDEVPFHGQHILEMVGVKATDGELQLEQFLGNIHKCSIPPVLK